MATAGAGSLQELMARQTELLQEAVALHQKMAQRLREQEAAALPSQPQQPPHDGSLQVPSVISLPPQQLKQPCDVNLGEESSLQQPLLAAVQRNTSGVFQRNVSAGFQRSSSSTEPQEKRSTVFPSADDIKARMAEALQRPEYNVEDLYSRTGLWSSIACAAWFKNLALLVIGLNTVWIAVETDYNKAAVLCDAPLLFQVVDNLFCAFFTFEIGTRFLAFHRKLDAFTDGWFVFDSSLVALMIWETWIAVAVYLLVGGTEGGAAGHSSILRILRMFRLTRVARMARLLRNLPELMILVKGMMTGIRAVSATLLLLFMIIYVFAVMFTQLLSGSEAGAGCFDTVPMAINCLLLEGVFTEQAEFIRKLLEADWTYYVFVLVYLLFVSLTVMNMLIAVLCEVVSVVAQVEKTEMMMKDLRFRLTDMMQAIGRAQGIRKEDLRTLSESPEALRGLHEIGVDVVSLVDLAEFIFLDRQELDLDAFMEVVLQFRGSNNATVKDVVDMRKFMCKELAGLETRLVKAKK